MRLFPEDNKMNDLKTLFDECEKNNWIPQHDCKKNLKIISQTCLPVRQAHSVNLPTGQAGSSHNIVIAQTKQCKICEKKFEETDPNGIK